MIFQAQSSVINAASAKEPCKRSLDARKGMDDYYKKKKKSQQAPLKPFHEATLNDNHALGHRRGS
jgi:hypothetical protein